MPVTYHEIKDRIIQAVEYVADFPDANIAKTARDFDVPYNRLRYRHKISNSRIFAFRCPNSQPMLDPEVFASLIPSLPKSRHLRWSPTFSSYRQVEQAHDGP
jgi:hypothetical protein